MFCSDQMTVDHFIVQTNIFLPIDATAVTLGQGQGKVTQYISPDLYVFCPKYLRFGSKGFDMKKKGKNHCSGRNKMKT